MNNKLLLLCAPSGSGKSTVARYLRGLDERFRHVQVITTRDLRDNEKDGIEKIQATLPELLELENKGLLVNLNQKYGTWYGITREAIRGLVMQGYFPVLEWPLERIEFMRRHFDVLSVLLLTANREILFERLKDGRDPDGTRRKELEDEFTYIDAHPLAADITVRNHVGDLQQVASLVYAHYLYHTA